MAKLEACAIEHVEANPGLHTGNIDHVIGRTSGAHRKYYYRRRQGGAWTAWESIKLDIEDNPVMLYVWDGRLLLFWVRILKQAPLNAQVPDPGNNAPLTSLTATTVNSAAATATQITMQAVLCYSEYYNGKWQAPKTSDLDDPAVIDSYAATGADAFDRSQLRLSVIDGNAVRMTAKRKGKGKGKKPPHYKPKDEPGTLRVSVDYKAKSRATFLLYNTHSLPVPLGRVSHELTRTLDTSTNRLVATYDMPSTDLTRALVENTSTDDALDTYHPLGHPLDAPFFYEDRRHVFYVTTSQEPKWIEDHTDIGINVDVSVNVHDIPVVVADARPTDKPRPPFWDEERVKPPTRDPGNVDPVPEMRRYLSEDAYLTHAIGNTEPVAYGDRDIGPANSQVAPRAI